MKRCLVIIIFVFFVPFLAQAQVSAGFLSDNIWYSQDPFFAGENVRIYSGIFNSSNLDIAGRVEFFDNGELIGGSDFNVEAGGNLVRVWTDWQALGGQHTIVASIKEARVTTPGQENQQVDLSNIKTQEDIRQIDIDTDQDGVGDEQDQDDDSDEVPDEIEQDIGTDPKEPEPPEVFEEILQENPDEDFDKDGIDNETEVASGTNPFHYTKPQEFIEARKEVSVPEEESHELRNKIIKPLPDSIETPVKKVDNNVARTFNEYIKALERKKGEVRGEIIQRKQEKELTERGLEDVSERTTGKSFLQHLYSFFLEGLIWILKTRIFVYLLFLFALYKILKMFIRRKKK